tara:strand:- start:2499 stop:2708 length:210 start_codon:yes stop_codon:yes gene_type:complete
MGMKNYIYQDADQKEYGDYLVTVYFDNDFLTYSAEIYDTKSHTKYQETGSSTEQAFDRAADLIKLLEDS